MKREMKQILHHPAAAAAALWYVARTSSDQSRLNIVGGPGPARLTGPPFKAPKASNREGNGDRASPPSRFGVCMGSVVSSPSGVLDRVPAENSFGTLPAWKNTWWQHIVWSMSCLMTRLPVLPPLSAPPRFGMYYVKKLTIDSIFNPTIGICTVLFMTPQKKITLSSFGAR